MAKIHFEDVGKVFPDGTRAIDGVSLDIDDGEFVVLVGPSGCGKSTLLRMLAGLEETTEGTIRIGDRVVNGVPPKDRDIAMVFQNYALYPHMSVFKNMAYSLRMRNISKDKIRERVEEAARTLEITDYLHRKPQALSGGQRQRVAMGRAIVREPAAFLMDEPLSNLDAKLRVQMRSELGELHQRLSTTTLYVTHDQVEAMTMGDRVAVIRKGVLQQTASPRELYRHPTNSFIGGFIGSPPMNFVYARAERDDGTVWLTIGENRLRLHHSVLDRRPELGDRLGDELVLGVRPESFEAVEFVSGQVDDERVMRVKVDFVEELGSEVLVHFSMAVRPVITPDIKELLEDQGDSPESLGSRTRFTAEVSPRVDVKEGHQLDLLVDTEFLHFFDPDNGAAIT